MEIPKGAKLIALIRKEPPLDKWEVHVMSLKDNSWYLLESYPTMEEAIEKFKKETK